MAGDSENSLRESMGIVFMRSPLERDRIRAAGGRTNGRSSYTSFPRKRESTRRRAVGDGKLDSAVAIHPDLVLLPETHFPGTQVNKAERKDRGL